MTRRHSYEYVKEFFFENGCVLLSKEYRNNRELLDYICKCGYKSKINFDHFKRGVRCKNCKRNTISKKFRFDYQYVYDYFKDHECVLISKTYNNCMELLDYICKCGRESKISFNNFKSGGHRCYECTKTKWDYGRVLKYFEDQGCVLLSTTYTRALDRYEYICSCGEKDVIQFTSFLSGIRCKECGRDKVRGENNPNWNGGSSTLNHYLRTLSSEWKRDSMKHSEFKCVITGNRFDVIHHLYGFNKITEEVARNLNLTVKDKISSFSDDELSRIRNEFYKVNKKYPLGVCLTKEVHEEFHMIYGYGDNTPDQFEIFKLNKMLKLNA